jgi:hypothetical protein
MHVTDANREGKKVIRGKWILSSASPNSWRIT